MKREPEPIDDDDDDFLEDLVTTTETDKGQPSYSTLEPGGFVTKGTDRKSRLDKRHAKIVAAAGKPEEAEGEVEETAQEQLEREADELTSQLKKAERAEAQALEKDQKDKAKCYSQRITSRKFLKKPKAVTDCDKIKGISVLLLETPLTRSKYFSLYTHAQRLTQTLGTFCTFAYKQTLHWWRIQCPVEGETNSGSSVVDCVHTAIFQNIRENRIP